MKSGSAHYIKVEALYFGRRTQLVREEENLNTDYFFGRDRGAPRLSFLIALILFLATLLSMPAVANPLPVGKTAILSGSIGATKIAKNYTPGGVGKFDLGKVFALNLGFRTADHRWKFVGSGSYTQNAGSELEAKTYDVKGIVYYYLWNDPQLKWGAFLGFSGGSEWLDLEDDGAGTYTALELATRAGVDHTIGNGYWVYLELDFGYAKTLSDIGLNFGFEAPLRL